MHKTRGFYSHLFLYSASIFLFLFVLSPAAYSKITLSSDTDLATAGYYQLSWSHDIDRQSFELQESSSGTNSYKTIYSGEDTETIISGKADGFYQYRVKSNSSVAPTEWSNDVNIEVKHHSLAKALSFFALGLLIFLATVLVIINGNKTKA